MVQRTAFQLGYEGEKNTLNKMMAKPPLIGENHEYS